jgi:hydroxyacylglutathione hydrolase
MKQITEGVFFIPGQDEMIPDSHVYLLGMPDSDDLSLIDAGLMGKGAYKLESIKESGVALSKIKRIIMTHTHLDHIGCLGELRNAIPHAELWIHENEALPLENGDEKTVYGMSMFESMCQAQYGIKPGDFRFPIDRKLAGGEALEIGNATWEVLHIPGHSAGSIALYQPKEKILIPGDTVYADHAIGRYDLHGASGPQLKSSLLLLADLDVTILLPGHNRIMANVPADYIRQTAEQWGPYLS